jgi:tRNA(adenine34) deaminase
VVFGADDPKAGFAGSLGNLLQEERLNHRTELTSGVLADDCAEVLRAFFRERR